MSDKPKYTLEVREFSPPTKQPWPAMDEAVVALKARGYSPVFAVPLSDPNGESEALVVVGIIAGCSSYDRP